MKMLIWKKILTISSHLISSGFIRSDLIRNLSFGNQI